MGAGSHYVHQSLYPLLILLETGEENDADNNKASSQRKKRKKKVMTKSYLLPKLLDYSSHLHSSSLISSSGVLGDSLFWLLLLGGGVRDHGAARNFGNTSDDWLDDDHAHADWMMMIMMMLDSLCTRSGILRPHISRNSTRWSRLKGATRPGLRRWEASRFRVTAFVVAVCVVKAKHYQ